VHAAGLAAGEALMAVLLLGQLLFDDRAGAFGGGRLVSGIRVMRRRARFF
jgi:hypothetical protein